MVTEAATSLRWQRRGPLTYRHEDLVDIHRSLGGSFHKEQTVVICIRLCLLTKAIRKKQGWKSVSKEVLPVRASRYLVIYSALVGQICFVSCQCDNNVGACLSLQFLHPVLCTCECVLEGRERTFKQNTNEKLTNKRLLEAENINPNSRHVTPERLC